MTKQIYMYENKINKIPKKVNEVGLGNYLLMCRSCYWKQKQAFFYFPKVLGNYGSSSWVSWPSLHIILKIWSKYYLR